NIIRGRPPYVEFEGFKVGNDQEMQICEGSPSRTNYPIMTLSGPAILQKAAEECFLNNSAEEIFKFTQVCLCLQQQCEMNGNVSHDVPKDFYLNALLDTSIPHYDNSAAQRGVFEWLYAGMMRRLRWVSSKLIS